MLLQTNSYLLPADRREEHARLMRRIADALKRLGCDSFEVHEEVNPDGTVPPSYSRFIQILRFRDRAHYQAVRSAEAADPAAQQLVAEFCELIDFAAQREQGTFAMAFYNNLLSSGPSSA